jgi:N-methylhydantoinase A
MANAVRTVTVRRGVDPRGLTLVPFGGAGPLHGSELANDLGITNVAVPPSPGLLCAIGLLVEDLRTDMVKTHLALLDVGLVPVLQRRFAEMELELQRWLDREGVPLERRRLERWLDLRYAGQNFELHIPVPPETWSEGEGPLRRRFLEAHEETYGFATDDEPIQVVNLRLVARGKADPPKLTQLLPPADGSIPRPIEAHDVYIDDDHGFEECPVYDRAHLLAGHRIQGPALIEQYDSTTWVLPAQEAEVDELGFLRLSLEGEQPGAPDELAQHLAGSQSEQ